MSYEAELSFLRQLLKNMNISSCLVQDPDRHIPPQIDLSLRGDLFGLDNYVGYLQNSMSQAKDRVLYRFYDEYSCNYIFLRLPQSNTYFFIGPYLLELPPQEKILHLANNLGLSFDQRKHMQLYYTTLPLIEDENLLLTMANTFASHLWGAAENYTLDFVDYAIPDRRDPIPHCPIPESTKEASLVLSMMEQNYESENQLLKAVSKGKLNMVTAMAATVFNNGAEPRLPDSLRDRKNYLIILKTLLRKAAEAGGVHPMHIHKLSAHYANQIENVRSIRQSVALQEEMIRKFCQLVKRHSLSKYSFYVGQTITLVQYDLTADLSLKAIAQKLNVNSSYLSALFHKEVGCTLTEFVNKQRVDHGITLLRQTSKTVQEIATECGIHDVNYFIKLFKKQTGMTPGHYRDTKVMQDT